MKKKTPIFITLAVVALIIVSIGLVFQLIDPDFGDPEETTADPDTNVTDTPSEGTQAPTVSTYDIYIDMSHGSYTGASQIRTGDSETIMLTSGYGYKLAPHISVTGCDYNYNASTGELVLKNPTSFVQVEVYEVGVYSVVCDAYDNCDVMDGGNYSGVGPYDSVYISIDPYENCTLENAIVNIYGSYDGYQLDAESGTLIISGICSDISWDITAIRTHYKVNYSFPNGGVELISGPSEVDVPSAIDPDFPPGNQVLSFKILNGYEFYSFSSYNFDVAGGISEGDVYVDVSGYFTPLQYGGDTINVIVKTQKVDPTYNITYQLSDGITLKTYPVSENAYPETAKASETVALTVLADSGYILPRTVTVTGCDYIYDYMGYDAAVLYLKNFTSNVTVKIEGEKDLSNEPYIQLVFPAQCTVAYSNYPIDENGRIYLSDLTTDAYGSVNLQITFTHSDGYTSTLTHNLDAMGDDFSPDYYGSPTDGSTGLQMDFWFSLDAFIKCVPENGYYVIMIELSPI